MLKEIGGEAAREKRVAVQAAVDLLNKHQTQLRIQADLWPDKQKADELEVTVQMAPILQETLRILKLNNT